MADTEHTGLDKFLALLDEFRKTCGPLSISEFAVPDWPENLRLEVALGKKDLYLFAFSNTNEARPAGSFPLAKATLTRLVDREMVLGIDTGGVLFVRWVQQNGDNQRAASRGSGIQSCLQTLLVFGQFLDEFAEKAGAELEREALRRKEMLERINQVLSPFLSQLVAKKLEDSNKPSANTPPR